MGKGNRYPTGWRNRLPGATVCARCLRLEANERMRDMARPGMRRGVKWCLECCLDYLEVPYELRVPEHADTATRRILA